MYKLNYFKFMGEFGFKDMSSGLKKEFYTKVQKPEVAKEVLFDRGLSVEGENITPIDLFSIPVGLTSDEKMEVISKNMQIDKKDLENKLPDISRYWREAKDFYKKFLVSGADPKAAFPREIENLDGFNNLHDLEKYLDKATLLKKGDNLGLSPSYCALFSLMIAEREYDAEEFGDLFNESKYLSEQLFKEDKDGIVRFHTVKEEDEDWNRVGIMTGENSWTDAKFSFRGKTQESVTAKLAKKPDFSMEERIRDGIGFKFEVANGKEASKLFLFMAETLRDNFETGKIVFENVNLFGNEEDESLRGKLREQGINSVPFEKNESSNENFKVAKFSGEIKVPKNGEEGKMTITRNFEVQVVLTNNKNETGLAQNKIYKRIQKLSLYTRLFGSFNEKYLDLICQEASEASGLEKGEIKKHIVDNFLLRVRTRSKNIKYVSRDQFKRWERAGLVPPGIKIDNREENTP